MADAGVDALIGIRQQLGARHGDAETTGSVHRTAVRVAVDAEGYDVPGRELAADRAADGHVAGSLGRIDDTVTGNVRIQDNGKLRGRGVDEIGQIIGLGEVARVIADLGLHIVAAIRQRVRHLGLVAAVGSNNRIELLGVSVGIGNGQRHRAAGRHALHLSGDQRGWVVAGIGRGDGDCRRIEIHAVGGGRAGAEGVAGIVATADGDIEFGVGCQIAAGNHQAVAPVGRHGGAVAVAVDDRGHGIARSGIAAD